MKKRDDVLVGIVIAVALVVVTLGALWLARGGLSKGYPLYAKFPWSAGLKQGQPVLLGGVNIGYEGWMTGSFDTGQGAVVMTNTNSGGQRLALEIIRGVAKVYGWSFATQVARNAIALDPKEQAAYIGRYRSNDDIFIIKIENAKLMIQRPNSSFRELFAESKQKFFVRESEVEYIFEMNDRGEAVKLTETFPYTADEVAMKIKE